MNLFVKTTVGLTLVVVFSGCLKIESGQHERKEQVFQVSVPVFPEVEVDSNTVFNVFQNPLPPKLTYANGRKKQLDAIDYAKSHLASDTLEEAVVGCGKKLAYAGLYFESLKMFSLGLEKYPRSYKLLRYRGENYIVLRMFDLAIEDLEQAAFYSRPAINEQEAAANTERYTRSLSNIKFNIFFNLGIAYYLKGTYDKAVSSFKKCQSYADNNDLVVLLSDWFYLTYRRIGNEEAAEMLLNVVNKQTKVKVYLDNQSRLLIYKRNYDPETFLSYARNDDNSLSPPLAYGIGTYYLLNGNIDRAADIYQGILLDKNWDTHDYIAAEVELRNLVNASGE